MTARRDLLISEDLMLLLLPESGKVPTITPGLESALTGALLVDLAEAGFIDILPGPDPSSPFIRPAEVPRPTDPMFVNAIALLGQKERPLASALPILLPRLDDVLLVRIGNHGILDHHRSRFLGLFPTSSWEVVDPGPEEQLRAALTPVLDGGAQPDVRTGTIIALLHAAEATDRISPPLTWDGRVAQQVAMAAWASEPVRDIVEAAAASARHTSTASTASARDRATGARVARASAGPDA